MSVPSPSRAAACSLPPVAGVVVVGGGLAALCAALAARQAGADVVLLEQATDALRGGNTRHSRNLRLAHAMPGRLMPGSYTVEEFAADLSRAGRGAGDLAVQHLVAAGSDGLAGWLARCGVGFQTDYLPVSRKTAFFLGGGKAAVNSLYRQAMACGVRVMTGCGVEAVDRDSRRVLLSDGRVLAARAVVVACGGYQGNRDWLATEWGALAEVLHNRGTPHADGRVLRALLDQGALASGMAGTGHLVAVDARSPQADGGIVTRVDGFSLGRVIDRAGVILSPPGETGPPRYSAWGRRVAAAGGVAFLVVGAAEYPALPLRVWPPERAETVAAVATLTGVAVPLLETALHGMTGPFGVVPIHPGLTFTGYGLSVDTTMAVRWTDGRRRPGLYAAGMIMAPQVLGSGYVAGAALTLSAVTGRRAGEEAARYAAPL